MRLRSIAAATLLLATPVLATGAPAYAAANHPHHAPHPSIRPVPGTVTENDSGNVSFAVVGMHLPPGTIYGLASPGLDAACSYNGVGLYWKADITGRFYDGTYALGCAPGRYQIIATEVQAPNTQYTSWLTIKPPASHGTRPMFYTSPSTVVESTDGGSVAFTLLGVHLPPGTTYTQYSPGLDTACFANTVSHFVVTADFNGNVNDVMYATGCNPGTYAIIIAQGEAPYAVYNTQITILPPSAMHARHVV